jgi:transposase-like protein
MKTGLSNRREYTPELKLKIVLESLQRDTTQQAVCERYGVTSGMINRWRNVFKDKAAEIFLDKRRAKQNSSGHEYAPDESPDELKKIIGDQAVQLEILKKVPGLLD